MKTYIQRVSKDELERKLKPNKVLILLGARRTDKTQLIRHFLEDMPQEKCLLLNGDDILDVQLLEERSVKNYERLLGNRKLLVINDHYLKTVNTLIYHIHSSI